MDSQESVLLRKVAECLSTPTAPRTFLARKARCSQTIFSALRSKNVLSLQEMRKDTREALTQRNVFRRIYRLQPPQKVRLTTCEGFTHLCFCGVSFEMRKLQWLPENPGTNTRRNYQQQNPENHNDTKTNSTSYVFFNLSRWFACSE